MALTAGSTVLTPTSHGSIKLAPELCVYWAQMYINMTLVINYDACHAEHPTP
jgi:hypothetical protein